MIIRKEYNVELLSAELTKEVIEAERVSNFYVKVPILVAKDIVDVLDETLEKKKRNQTLESELQFVETEDKGQTNEMEEEMNKEIPRIIKEHVCFGKYDKDSLECGICDYKYECKEKYEEYFKKKTPKRKRPSCFKHFYDNNKQCDNTECIHRKECVESIKITKPECFGDFDCKMISCQRCDSCNECMIETK